MTNRRIAVSAVCAIALFTPTLARAEAKATLRDRFDQLIATFMGDPAAGVDIDMKHVLDKWRSMGPKPLEGLSAQDARRQPTPIIAAAALAEKLQRPLLPFPITVSDIQIAGPAGPLAAKVYSSSKTGGKPTPIVVFFHGGGFVTDNAEGSDASARAIAGQSGFIVVAPAYRLAPGAKFPAAQEDCAAAYKWVADNAARIGGDPEKLALAGEGAGGMLAVDAAIAARDNKWTKAAALVLITPAAGTDLKTNSWLEDSAARPWNKAAVQWALKLYLPNDDAMRDPRIDIVGLADVSNLPPTTIVTAEIDPLRSDGERLGGKLKRATVPVSMRDYPGVTHDFFGMGSVVEKAALAQQFVATQLRKAFAPPVNQALALQELGIAPYPEAPDPAVTPPATATVPNK